MLTRAFKGFDIFKIQRFQGLRDEEFQGSKVQGFKDNGLLGSHRSKGSKGSKGLKGLSKKFHGEGIGRPILTCLLSSIHLNATLYSEAVLTYKVTCTSNTCACAAR